MSSVQPVQAGDESDAARRFREELDVRYRAALMHYFARRVQSADEAEDLTQEVFLRLVAQANSFALEAANGYVFTIAANLLRDRTRRAVTHRAGAHRSLDDPKNVQNGLHLVEEIGPERVLLGRENLRAAMEALGELDERTRDIFVLFRLERMRHRDIAALYGLTVSSVEKHVLKAGRHLAKRLKQK